MVKSKDANKRKPENDKSIALKELKRAWSNFNLSHFWAKVIQAVSKEADAYERAQAKSKETITVFY